VARTLDAGDGVTAIDTEMFGRENVTSAYLVAADRPTLVETGSGNDVEQVRAGLEALGVGPEDLAHIVVTHIHLDHAGGVGSLAPHYPRATVWVHERGAPHLADPSRLVASAGRVFGEERMRAMFGPVEPLPQDRMRSVVDGDEIDLGDRSLRVLSTPGHASHHVALLDSASGGVFVGDALGVFLPDVRILRPATAPPEFDLEQAVADIRRLQGIGPSRILFSHFGPAEEVEHLTNLAIKRLRRWTSVVETAAAQTQDVQEVVRMLREGTAAELNPAGTERMEAISDRYELLSSYEMNARGILRYLRGRREAETS
jgi:glyoxylase-like metal-dependent hydrolase (beta-lactamase superfamily II)